MKIGLIGPQQSGKTVYFSGLAYRFGDEIGFGELSGQERATYKRLKVKQRAGIQVSFASPKIQNHLQKCISTLRNLPVENSDWADPTKTWNETEIKCRFRFQDWAKTEDGDEDRIDDSFVRHFEIYDPAGGAISGIHDDSEEIIDGLLECDAIIVFIDAKMVIECMERNDRIALQNGLKIGRITEIIDEIQDRMPRGEILPICFAISKFDEVVNLNENAIIKFERMVYNDIVLRFSKLNPDIMICACPISVVDPEARSFKAHNLEWPFIFSAAATIFRNSLVLRDDSDYASLRAQEFTRSANDLSNRNWFARTWKSIRGDGVEHRRRLAAAYRNDCGRLIAEADDDSEFSKNLWTSLAIEGLARNVNIYRNGRQCRPSDVLAYFEVEE